MAYKQISNDYINFLEDVSSRKEFNNFMPKFTPMEITGYTEDDVPLVLPGIQFFGAQNFIKNFINPNTPYNRLLLKWQVGTGKSKAVAAIGHEFIKNYKLRASLGERAPQVFVIAFTQDILQDEMLKDPVFGFANNAEIFEWNSLKIAANRAGSGTPEMQKYATFLGILRRRITDKSRGGYYRFYGYKSFVNQLFIITSEGEKIKFNILNHCVKAAADDADTSYTAAVNQAIKNHYITINVELLNSMRGALLICDEIHNVYNIVDANNYGIAIQYVLDTLGADAPRCVFMSATPITGAASEVVDLLNLMVPRAELKEVAGREYLVRSDMFTKCTTYEDTESDAPFTVSALKPGALDVMRRLFIGRVSFLLDADTKNYPQRVLVGETITDIPYLKITPCPYSELQESAFLAERATQDPPKSDLAGLAMNAYALNNIVFPGPNGPLYDSNTIISTLQHAPPQWLEENKIRVEKVPPHGLIIRGAFLHQSSLAKYSTKYYEMLKLVLKIISEDCGKIMIYENRVKISGVLIIQEILRENGILGEHELPTDDSICNVCGVKRGAHAKHTGNIDIYELYVKKPPHAFTPTRFVIVNSDIDQNTRTSSLSKFNSTVNAYGQEYRILVASKIIKEGYDMKDDRHQIICSMPINYPIAIQVMGRIIRRKSHIGLPHDLWQGYIYFLASMRQDGKMTPEIKKYIDKGREYQVIQEIDKCMSINAVDAFMNYEKIKHVQEIDKNLTILPYEPTKLSARPMQTTTFNAYEFDAAEIQILISIIRILFKARPVFAYNDLIEAINNHVISNINYDKFEINNINAAIQACKEPQTNGGYYIVYLGGEEQFYLYTNGLIDYNCFMRQPAEQGESVIDITAFVGANLQDRNFELRLADLELYGVDDKPLEFILTDFNDLFHSALLRRIVSKKYKNEKIIKLYKRFKILINDNAFIDGDHVTVYDKTWSSAPLSDYNIGKRTRENNIIIGMVSRSADNSVLSDAIFKLRPPMQNIKSVTDFRNMVRGVACKSYPRTDLFSVIESLKRAVYRYGGSEIQDALNIDAKNDMISTFSLCQQVKKLLLELEELARKENMIDSTRWLYL